MKGLYNVVIENGPLLGKIVNWLMEPLIIMQFFYIATFAMRDT